MLTGRVTKAQASALRAFAATAGLPMYQATVRALEAGIAILVGGELPNFEASSFKLERKAHERGVSYKFNRLIARADDDDRRTRRILRLLGEAPNDVGDDRTRTPQGGKPYSSNEPQSNQTGFECG